jgi:hypothetical protein
MKQLRRHLTYANVVATLALMLVIAGGTAIAASKNTVTSTAIKPYNVTARDLAGTRVVQATGQFKATASCSGGQRLIGGGGNAGTTGVGVSSPASNGWFVQQAGGPDTLVSAYALCLKAKPGK